MSNTHPTRQFIDDSTESELETVGGPASGIGSVQDGGDNHHGEVVNANFRFRGDCLPAPKPREPDIDLAADERLFEAERKAWEAGRTVMLMDVEGETN